MTCVLDASVALAWVFERAEPAEAAQARGFLERLDQEAALVPELWHLEVLNALIVAERRGVISAAKTSDFLNRLHALPIETESGSLASQKAHLFGLARQYGLSAYDTAYLELAMRTGSTLVTFDRRLAEACDRAGVGRV